MVSLPPDFMAKVVGRLAEARGDTLSEIYPTSAGVDFFALAKDSAYVVIDESWRFDATSILALLAKIPKMDRIVCVYLGKKLTRPQIETEAHDDVKGVYSDTAATPNGRVTPIERRSLLASALSAQLVAFGIESTFLELLGTDDVREVSCADVPLMVGSCDTTLERYRDLTANLGLSKAPYESELRSRFGDVFLEYDGVPYAKVLETGGILTGSSFAESEFLELSHEGRALESLLGNLRVSLMKCRSDRRYYEIFTSMWSRSLSDRVLFNGMTITRSGDSEDSNEIEKIDTAGYVLGDYYRSGYVGKDPYSDLKKATNGFYGHSGDPLTYAIKRRGEGFDLLFTSMSIDISVPAKVGEIVTSFSSQVGAVQDITLVVTPGLLKFERIKELLRRLDFSIRVLAIDESWRSEQNIGVVDVGVY